MKDKLEAMELKPNMYVRTNDGYISNVNNINDKNIYNNNFLKLGIIKKSSYNIIDILEVGDIISYSDEKHEILLIDDELMVRNTGLIYDKNDKAIGGKNDFITKI